MNIINGIKSKKTYWIFALLCAALWGSGTVCLKVAYGAFGITADDTASQLLLIGLRFMLASAVTQLVFGAGAGKILLPQNGAAWRHAAILSVTQIILLYGFYSVGAANATGTMAVMINGTSTFFTILFATLVFRTERMDLKKAIACLIGFGAILIMNMNGLRGPLSFTLKGEGALLFSQFMAGLSHNITKKFGDTDEPAMLFAWQFLLGGTALFATGLALGGRLGASGRGWAVLVYLAFTQGIAFSIWGRLMKYHPVSRINIFNLANPLFGVLFSALLLGETAQAFSLRTFVSLLLIGGGILLLNVTKREKDK